MATDQEPLCTPEHTEFVVSIVTSIPGGKSKAAVLEGKIGQFQQTVYRIVQNFGGVNFWWMKLEDAFGW